MPCPDGVCPTGQVCDPASATCGVAAVDAAPADEALPDGDASACSLGCGDTTPICEGGACRACVADSECPSDACLEYTGRCADEAEVIYVAPTGAGGECSRTTPCRPGTAGNRVTPTRTVIRFAPGNYADQARTNNVAGDVPAILSGPARDPALAVVTTNNASSVVLDGEAVLEGLTIVAPMGDGITVRAEATLHRVHVMQTAESGIETFASVHVFDSRIDDASTYGIYGSANGLDVEVVRSTIIGCESGGISLVGSARLTVASSVIARNGGLTSPAGGIFVAAPRSGSTIRYATIADNEIDPAIGVPGIHCGGQMLVTSSILATNGSSVAQVDSACGTTNTLFSNSPIAMGGGNLLGAPRFTDADYHISPQSDARDEGVGSPLPTDIDGEARPLGMAPDLGADEIP